jgi:hypothetical protein
LECDVCLGPLGPTVFPFGLPAAVCLDCFVFAQAAVIPLSAAADFLELCRMNLTETKHHGLAALEALLTPEAPPPPVAGVTIPAPDPTAEPGPESNIIRVFQWPAHCGQWYARVGSPGDRRSIQYGPLRTAAEVLEGFAKHLAARGYRFDGGYEPPAQ